MVVYNLDTLSHAPQVVPFPEGELFVNDMALAGDTLYVTVTNTGNIYSLDVSAPSKLDPQAAYAVYECAGGERDCLA